MTQRTAYRTCPLCEATCGLELTVEDGRATKVRGDRRDVFSHGFLCPKGVAITELHDDSSSWSRNGEIVFLSELGLGQYGVVIIRAETPEYAANLRWERSIGAGGLDRLRGLYKEWDPVIGRVLDAIDDIQAYPLESGPWLRQLSKEGRVALIGRRRLLRYRRAHAGEGVGGGRGGRKAVGRRRRSKAAGPAFDVLHLRPIGEAFLPHVSWPHQSKSLLPSCE